MKNGKGIFHWILSAALAVTSFAVLSLWLTPDPVISAIEDVDSNDSWVLPAPRDKKEILKSYQVIADWQKKNKLGAVDARKQLDWNFRGVVFENNRYFALIEVNKVLQRFKSGDKLPDGKILHEVGESSLVVKDREKILSIPLYEK